MTDAISIRLGTAQSRDIARCDRSPLSFQRQYRGGAPDTELEPVIDR